MNYVAGKIRNYKHYEIVFKLALKYLKKRHIEAITAPMLLDSINYRELKENEIITNITNFIYNADVIYFLPNHKTSKGAELELHLANYFHKKIIELDWFNIFPNSFLKEFEKTFEVSLFSRKMNNLQYKYILQHYLMEIIGSYYLTGKLFSNTKSNPYSTVVNAVSNAERSYKGLNGIEIQKEYEYKRILVYNFIEEYCEN